MFGYLVKSALGVLKKRTLQALERIGELAATKVGTAAITATVSVIATTVTTFGIVCSSSPDACSKSSVLDTKRPTQTCDCIIDGLLLTCTYDPSVIGSDAHCLVNTPVYALIPRRENNIVSAQNSHGKSSTGLVSKKRQRMALTPDTFASYTTASSESSHFSMTESGVVSNIVHSFPLNSRNTLKVEGGYYNTLQASSGSSSLIGSGDAGNYFSFSSLQALTPNLALKTKFHYLSSNEAAFRQIGDTSLAYDDRFSAMLIDTLFFKSFNTNSAPTGFTGGVFAGARFASYHYDAVYERGSVDYALSLDAQHISNVYGIMGLELGYTASGHSFILSSEVGYLFHESGVERLARDVYGASFYVDSSSSARTSSLGLTYAYAFANNLSLSLDARYTLEDTSSASLHMRFFYSLP